MKSGVGLVAFGLCGGGELLDVGVGLSNGGAMGLWYMVNGEGMGAGFGLG